VFVILYVIIHFFYEIVIINFIFFQTHPSHTEEFVTMATEMPGQLTWAVLMAGGGHFAGAIFHKYV